MKIRHRIQQVPDGDPYGGATVAIRKVSDNATIATVGSDSDGWVEYECNGHPEAYVLYVTGIAGGDRFLDSRDAGTAGVLSLAELPVALRVLGDGVVRGYANALEVTVGVDTITVATGAANVIGHPFVTYTPTVFPYSRPVSGTRIDRAIIRLYPEGSATTPGKADLVLLAGVVDAGVTALTQTATVYEIGLAQVSVPSAGAVTVTDERTWAGESPLEADVVRAAAVSTANASGEALTGLSLTRVLPRAATYDITAKLSARQTVSAWVLQATYSQFGAGNGDLNTPNQVARDSLGNIYVAEYGNDRVSKFDSTGAWVSNIITGVDEVTGLCIDSSDNIYISYKHGTTDYRVRKYNSAGTLQWTGSLTSPATLLHLATNSTNVYVVSPSAGVGKVIYAPVGTGVFASNFGAPGSGDGQLATPYGIAYNAVTGTLYVVDAGNSRVQEFTVAGVYVRQWAISASARGCAIDATGNVLVAEYGSDVVKRYTALGVLLDSFSQTDPDGLAVATGDVAWVSNTGSSTLAKWDEVTGYGEVAVEIDANVGTYLGIGNRAGAVANSHSVSVVGPASVVVRAFGKATSGTLSLKGAVLSAIAKARG